MTTVLNWIKTHLLIVIMCAISIIVLPAVIFASSAWNAKIAKGIAARVNAQNLKINNVSSVQVNVTPLIPDAPSISQKLAINPRMLEDYRGVREQIKNDAVELEQWAVEVNRAGKETQLVPGLLPEPSRSAINELPFRIHGAFIKAHEDLLKQVGAGMPPSPDLVQEQLVEFDRNYRRTQFNIDPGTLLSETEQTKLLGALTTRRLAIYAQSAQEYSVYADMGVFTLDPWEAQNAPDKLRWYEWQHTYWINSDIVAAVVKANTIDGQRGTIAGETASVIKRVVNIVPARLYPISLTEASLKPAPAPGAAEPSGGFQIGGPDFASPPMGGPDFGGGPTESSPPPRSKYGDSFGPVATESGNPASAPVPPADASAYADAGQLFASTFTNSISGRYGRTGLYDMRAVTVTLIVDSRRLQEMFDAFHSTNFMTVVGFKTQPLDISIDLAQGFYYGSNPVIEVELNIETLWLRDWTVELMPPPVRLYFGIVDNAPQG